jgi:hypothetical protein
MTRLLQPIGASWARSLKTLFTKVFHLRSDQRKDGVRRVRREFARVSEGQKLRVTIVSAICDALHQATTASHCQGAFRASGRLPWDPQQVVKPWTAVTRARRAQIRSSMTDIGVRTASTTAHASSHRRRHAGLWASSRSGGSERPT